MTDFKNYLTYIGLIFFLVAVFTISLFVLYPRPAVEIVDPSFPSEVDLIYGGFYTVTLRNVDGKPHNMTIHLKVEYITERYTSGGGYYVAFTYNPFDPTYVDTLTPDVVNYNDSGWFFFFKVEGQGDKLVKIGVAGPKPPYIGPNEAYSARVRVEFYLNEVLQQDSIRTYNVDLLP